MRNSEWFHMVNQHIISMPDKWEYPWYAAWDLAFHTIALSTVDVDFAKEQLDLMLQEFFLHPTGQIPAYEWNFSDVNPPVHAWATIFLYRTEQALKGQGDLEFLKRSFSKLMLNFSWWVNRKDRFGKNLFEGGFLGLDNIGVFDRSAPLPTGGYLEQADGTAWMALYAQNLLDMAIELTMKDPIYENLAVKFYEHFIWIASAMGSIGQHDSMWDEEDGFYYDQLLVNGSTFPLKVRSMVGLIPLLAVEVLDDALIQKLPGFKKRMDWFLQNRPDLNELSSYYCRSEASAGRGRRLLAIPSCERLQRVLRYVLDENEFLSPYGIRSVSRVHKDRPYVFHLNGQEYRVDYEPGESSTGLFGGNSNWRGPIWFPLNYLLIESLERYYHFYRNSLLVEFPTGSGKTLNLKQVADELSLRLCRIFLPGKDGKRPCDGDNRHFGKEPSWQDLILFHEYFHGETGRGLGASHQTGWTSLVIRLLENLAKTKVPSGSGSDGSAND
jgi:hypothetical protein